MAAVIELRTGTALDPRALPVGPRNGSTGPQLRLLDGGRSPHARHMRRVYFVRRALVLAGLFVAVVVLAQIVRLAAQPIAADVSPVAVPAGATVYTVQPGDTLWGIAAAVDPAADPRSVVAELRELNASGPALGADGTLRDGAALRLPSGD